MPPFTPCLFFFLEGFLCRNRSAFCSFLLLYFCYLCTPLKAAPPAAMKCAGTRHWGREVQATHLMVHSPRSMTMPTYPDCQPGSHSPFQLRRALISLASLSALSTPTQMASFSGSTEQTQLTFVKISSQQQLAGSLF